MKDLFQRLVEMLGLDKSSDMHETDTPDTPHQPSRSEIRSEAQVRTKTIYPRETEGRARFRFPLIPDEKGTPTTTATTLPTNTNSNVRNNPESRPMTTTTTMTESKTTITTDHRGTEPKRHFQPSEFFSPVYGSKRPILEDRKDSTVEPLDRPHERQSTSEIEKNDQEFVAMPKNIPIREIVKQEPVLEIPEEIEQSSEQETTSSELSSVEEPRTAKIIAFPKRETVQFEETPIPLMNREVSAPMEEVEKEAPPSRELWNQRVEQQSEEATTSKTYEFPDFDYLKQEPSHVDDDMQFVHQQISKLTYALENFNVSAEVVGVVKGPTVTRFELQPAPGVKVNKFTNLIDDIKLALAAKDIRMEAPIPGRSAIGIEVPNDVSSPVFIRSMLESEEFQNHESPLAVALGRDIGGQPIIGDLRKMPHGLIAGSTGSGKSVCINSILVSLLYKAKPSELRLILIDPKVVELAPYNHIPHLLTPVVTDPKQATAALKWAVEEMEKRYERFAEIGVRDIGRFNVLAEQEQQDKLPYILIIIDELADLMMVSPHEVEESICRIAQKARACGIHLLVATQRPSVDVITGLIKANIPTRIAFAVSSQADSRTILDMGGAERLLGKGDMLYYPSGLAKPLRVQGNFVSDEEIEQVVEHVKSVQKVKYLIDKEELIRTSNTVADNDDELFSEALLFTIEQGQASASSLQRRFRIGYNRAARLIDMMEGEGFITGQSGSKARDVLITMDEYQQIFD